MKTETAWILLGLLLTSCWSSVGVQDDDAEDERWRVNPHVVWGIVEAKDCDDAMAKLLAYCGENKLWY